MIWTILILTSITSALGLFTLQANAETAAHAQQIYKRHGLGITAPVGCLLAVLGVAIPACWCVYAWQVSDWRFAAYALIGALTRVVSEVWFKRTKAKEKLS